MESTQQWASNLKRLRRPGKRRADLQKPSASLLALHARLKKGDVIVDIGCGESGDVVAMIRSYEELKEFQE